MIRRALRHLLEPPRALIDQPTLAELRLVLTRDADGQDATRALYTEHLPLPPVSREATAVYLLDEALNLYARQYGVNRRRVLLQLGQLTRGQ
jgi:hypothetical protein